MKAFKIFALAALLGLSFTTQAGDYANATPAVGGYDVVSYQTDGGPVRGSGHYVGGFEGVTYLFVNQANLDTFKADPVKYVPAYGGYCAFGVSVGKKFVADPEVWRVVDGTLYLNLDANIQSDWLKDIPGRIAKAEGHWPTIKDKNPASL
ncbi:MAG: YHS domain-containing (seleno)protein [Gammaproteobacteria bacterium]